MTFASFMTFLLICTACYYVVARAKITRPFWGSIGDQSLVGRLLACAACSGTWLGALIGLWHPLTPQVGSGWMSWLDLLIVHAAAGMVLTAIGWATLKGALAYGAVGRDGNS